MDSSKQGNPLKKPKNIDHMSTEKTFTPREYQIEILEIAKKENTIACLGTGTGKTFIAVMLIRENANAVRTPFSEGGKRTFFLVPTVPLVTQQSKTVEEHTDLKVQGYSGDMDIDSWNKDKWTEEFIKYEVLVMTAEIFRIIVDHAFISLSKINLLIIDECHRAQGDHPYRQALKCFIDLDSKDMPRIFGLSASLLNGKCKPTQLENRLLELEKTLMSHITTASDIGDLQKYGTDPDEYVIYYKPYVCPQLDLLKKVDVLRTGMRKEKSVNLKYDFDSDEEIVFFDKPLRCLNSLYDTLSILGPWCAYKAAEVFSKELNSVLFKSKNGPVIEEHREMLQEVQQFLAYFKEECSKLDFSINHNNIDNWPNKLKRLLNVFQAVKESKKFRNEYTYSSSITFTESPEKYNNFLKQKQNNAVNSDVQLCSIIFVEQRITAYVLYQWMIEVKRAFPEFDFLKPEFIVGHGSYAVNETAMSIKRQRNALKEFRKKNCNILIATSVLEEGMDIQQCNVVLRFDLPKDFRGYVQSKGRARAKNSVYLMLVQKGKDTEKFLFDMCNFKTIEEMLLSKCCDRTIPGEEEIQDYMLDSALPPYMPYGPNGPRITMTSAISLINRYCASLPCDMATKLTPKWKIRVVDPDSKPTEYECVLRMPINSPLRGHIIGQKMSQKRHARMASALKACQLLDEIGELNEHLVPISCLVDKALDEELGPQEIEETTNGAAPGTNRSRHVYKKRVPIFLKDSRPIPGSPCYLNIIEMNLVVPLPDVLNPRKRPIINPADTTRGLGLLTSKQLPLVNSFRIYTKIGKILVTVSPCKTPLLISDDKLQKIEKFHRFIISDTLWIEKDKIFAPDISELNCYIVPINKGFQDVEIDWNFIHATEFHPYHTMKKSGIARTSFSEESFTDAVLMRAYKMNELQDECPTFHHVINIRYDKTPLSSLDSAKYWTYKEYYKGKFNIDIQNENQPLVETVQYGSLHFWKPLYVSPKETFDDLDHLSSSKQRHMNYREYLVPELSIIHPFPSSFFMKVRCLPTILFRLCSLLLAEEVRLAVARESYVGAVHLPNNFCWPDFVFETSDKELRKHIKEPLNNAMKPQDILKSGEKIHSFEVAVQLNGHTGPSPSLILQALTSKRTGDEFDLERLEMIGDSFLKYTMSVKTYLQYPNFDEGKLTKLRSGLIQNVRLYRCAKKRDIPEYLICSHFSCSSTWLPPCYCVEETVDPNALKKSKSDTFDTKNVKHDYFTKQIISDKCIADSVEALIGSYLLSCGQKGALMFMSWLGLKPLPTKREEICLSDFENWPPAPPNPILSNMRNVPACLQQLTNGFERFENIINYRFKNKAYLLQAFTHPSYSYNEITDCYQRLEFLGDAVLDYLITRQLYEDPNDHSPGKLTDLRSALVNNIFFASLAVKYKYNEFLKMLSPRLFGSLTRSIDLLMKSEAFCYFLIHGFYLEEIECFELEEVEVPKALGDVFESVAGAVYLDSGMSLDTVWKVYYPMIEPALKHLSLHVPKSPVRELYEELKTQKCFGESLQKNDKTYIEVTVKDGTKFVGVGPNKKVAKRSAAKRALAYLKNQNRDTS